MANTTTPNTTILKFFKVLGTFFMAVGVIMLLVAAPAILEHRYIEHLVVILILAVPFFVTGLICTLAAKAGFKRIEDADEKDDGNGVAIVSTSTIAASPRTFAGGNGPEGVLLKAQSAIPALADWMDHAPAGEPAALLGMLDRTGVRNWADTATLHAHRIGRTGRIWLRPEDEDDARAGSYEAMVAVEAAVNIRADVLAQDLPATQEGIEAVLRATCDLPIAQSDTTMELVASCHPVEGSNSAARLAFSTAMEDVRPPFRMLFSFRSSLSEHRLAVDVEIPTPSSLVVVSTDGAATVCAARAYALRHALLAARCAFAASPEFARVYVNCHAHGTNDALLSLDLDRGRLDALLAVARSTQVEGSAFPQCDYVRASFDERGWFAPVEPFARVAEVDADDLHEAFVELVDVVGTPSLMTECGAARTRDLGILEEAARKAAWREIEPDLGDSTGDAVALLSRLRDSATQVDVAAACGRVIKALAEGGVDIEDRQALYDLFVNGDPFNRLVAATMEKLSDDPSPAEEEAALAQLEAALADYDSTGLYMDDSESVYRFFSSVADRVAYNLSHLDDARCVRLVPDAYYQARRLVCTILNNQGEEGAQRALAHVREVQRIAPATVDADLTAVRTYEVLSHNYAAADQLVETIEKCRSARYLAICFYRLAFMEWHLDEAELAAACYVHALSYNVPDIRSNALQELKQLCAEEDVEAPSPGEAIHVLEEHGVPIAQTERIRGEHFRAALACIDSGAYKVALPLLTEGFLFGSDDAMADVYHSICKEV